MTHPLLPLPQQQWRQRDTKTRAIIAGFMRQQNKTLTEVNSRKEKASNKQIKLGHFNDVKIFNIHFLRELTERKNLKLLE